jgi:hypothetical protein
MENQENHLRLIIILIYLFLLAVTGHAQTGVWNPINSNSSYPRTIIKQEEIPLVRGELEDPVKKELYKHVYASAQQTPPTGDSNGERLRRGHIAKNSAFVVLMNRKIVNNSVIELTAAERDNFKEKAVQLLGNISTGVAGLLSDYDSWQWRSKELIDFATAYDLLKGSGIMDNELLQGRNKIAEFTGNLFNESTRSWFGVTFFNSVKNNHAIKVASSIGFSAIVLNDYVSTDPRRQPLNWINLAMWNIDNLFFRDSRRQTEPGIMSGYSEGPYYLKYSAINFIPFWRASGNFLGNIEGVYSFNGNLSNIKTPKYDERYSLLFEWGNRIKMPNGYLPPIEDTYAKASFDELVLTGDIKYRMREYNITELPELTVANSDNRAMYISTLFNGAADTIKSFEYMPESGNLVFRSGAGNDALYMHVTAENGIPLTSSGGHNQADVSSFLIYAYGEMLALDPGYISYTRRNEVSNANNHNMILVNGEGPLAGTPSNPNDAEGFLENGFTAGGVSYGEARTAYKGANIKRSFLFNGSYFVIADDITSMSNNNYTWQLHGNGLAGGDSVSGNYSPDYVNNKGVFNKRGVRLMVHSIASGGGLYSTGEGVHEISYNSSGIHSVMNLEKKGVKNSNFLSVLYPYKEGPAPDIKTVDSINNVVTVNLDGEREIMFVQQEQVMKTILKERTGLYSDISSDGLFTSARFGGVNYSEIKSLFLNEGKKYSYGKELIASNVSVKLLFEKKGERNYSGYINKSSEIVFDLGGSVETLSGINVAAWEQLTGGRVKVLFSGEGKFSIVRSDEVPVQLVFFLAEVMGNNVLLKWKTATEINNMGFEIYRGKGNYEWELIGFAEGNGTTTSERSYIFNDNPERGSYKYKLVQVDYDGTRKEEGIISVELTGAPGEYFMEQNYPNPFNPKTKIKYSLAEEGEVFIALYDLTGREIVVLVNERRGEGDFEVILDAAELNLSSGSYFYRMRAGDFVKTKKLLLMK